MLVTRAQYDAMMGPEQPLCSGLSLSAACGQISLLPACQVAQFQPQLAGSTLNTQHSIAARTVQRASHKTRACHQDPRMGGAWC